MNDVIYFDKNEYLREKTSNPLKLKQVISQAKYLLKNSNASDTNFLYGILGNLYRIKGQPQKAMTYLTFCLDQAVEEGHPTKEVVSLIRLGEALKYDNNQQMALNYFNRALEICETHKIDEYLDFALQHKGKCLLELAKLNESLECFQIALTIRRRKRNHSLIESTEQAIKLVKEIQG